MQNRKRDTDVQNRLLDSVGEGEGGMFRENSIETCILSRVKQITSPGWMHETSARAWCTGKTQRNRWRGTWEGGSGWGIHVTPWLIHVNVWQNPLQYCKVISLQLIKINEKKIVLSFCWKRSFSSQTFLDSLSLAQLNPQVSPAVKLFHLWISIYLVNVLCTCFVSTILPKAKERKNGNLSEG